MLSIDSRIINDLKSKHPMYLVNLVFNNPKIIIKPLFFEPLKNENIIFNNKDYIEGYKSENRHYLNFVIWPSLIRNDNKHILTKQIAVFKNEIPTLRQINELKALRRNPNYMVRIWLESVHFL